MEAYQPRHWVRCVTACNNRCLFCLDADTPRDEILSLAELARDIHRGIEERGATRLVLSGGEPTLHPDFAELVALGVAAGYERVQCITNGHRFADPAFLQRCLDAGLGEITFSLHGHSAALHDRLTQTPGSFDRLIAGLARAVRAMKASEDQRPVVNIDVCLNQQNIAHLEQIVELGLSLGVSEFDLLHVIPQAAAFENRTRLFYDVREHLPTLQRVLRLNRHPRVQLWTNRLPATHLEGFEELIQSPRKLADELAGRHRQVRAYLDESTPLACRDPARCPHCFLEPFCTTMDRVLHRLRTAGWKVWWVGDGPPPSPSEKLPYGCTYLGRRVASLDEGLAQVVPPGTGLYLEVANTPPEPLPTGGLGADTRPVILVAREPSQLATWLEHAHGSLTLEIVLNRRTAPWLLAHRDALEAHLSSVRLVQPGFATLADTRAEQVDHPAALFTALDLRIRCSGLPACLAPGTRLVAPTRVLDQALFEPPSPPLAHAAPSQRLNTSALLRHHLRWGYRVRSARCADCVLSTRCAGLQINIARHLGLGVLTPLTASPHGPGDPDAPPADARSRWGAEALRQLIRRWPEPPTTVGGGRPPEPPRRPPCQHKPIPQP